MDATAEMSKMVTRNVFTTCGLSHFAPRIIMTYCRCGGHRYILGTFGLSHTTSTQTNYCKLHNGRRKERPPQEGVHNGAAYAGEFP